MTANAAQQLHFWFTGDYVFLAPLPPSHAGTGYRWSPESTPGARPCPGDVKPANVSERVHRSGETLSMTYVACLIQARFIKKPHTTKFSQLCSEDLGD